MIKINFNYLESGIELEKGKGNILVITISEVFSKIVFSLYNKEDYFKIYDSKYKVLSNKDIITILNPLLFDFQDRVMKSTVYDYFAKQFIIDYNYREDIITNYNSMANSIINHIETVGEIEFEYNDEIDIKDLFKMVGLSINQNDIKSVFEKTQLVINVLNEIANDKLLIFINLKTLLSEQEYKEILKELELKSLTVLLIENDDNKLKGVDYYMFDNDFILNKM